MNLSIRLLDQIFMHSNEAFMNFLSYIKILSLLLRIERIGKV